MPCGRTAPFYLTGIADRMVLDADLAGAPYRKRPPSRGRAARKPPFAGIGPCACRVWAARKDLAAVQRNTEIMKLSRCIGYTPFSALYARMRDAGHST